MTGDKYIVSHGTTVIEYSAQSHTCVHNVKIDIISIKRKTCFITVH